MAHEIGDPNAPPICHDCQVPGVGPATATENFAASLAADALICAATGCLGEFIALGRAGVTAFRALGTVEKSVLVPRSLMDEMVLSAAKEGKGIRIIENLRDPRFKGMEKWSYGETSASGLRSEVHYVRNPRTGELLDFKFKHHAGY